MIFIQASIRNGVDGLYFNQYDKGNITMIDMPKNTKVYQCVQKVMRTGKGKESAIKICQKSTGQSYKTGKK